MKKLFYNYILQYYLELKDRVFKLRENIKNYE